jgi:probable F420-dependent oxidoreductase
MSTRPFRFTISMPPLGASLAQWRDQLRRIDDLGFSSVSISDHLTGGWQMDPIVAMTVAAEATTRLRVLSMVLCNDFRHPVTLHRSMANLDVFSGGRVEIGLGAGWKEADYRASGVQFAPASARVARLAESIEVLKGLFGPEPVTYVGTYYQVSELAGLPRPVQRPHPPLFVGGGSRRILELAGRAADIVGLNPRLASGVEDMTADRLRRKIGWARSGAIAAGRAPEELEFQQSLVDVRLTHRGVEHRWSSSLARGVPLEALAASPSVLHGDLDDCVDALVERRARYGISYLHLGGNLEAAALIVDRLSGS